jgi:DNA-3-methyladenine glycosylase
MKPLGREFFARGTLEVARDLLGCVLVHELDSEVRAGIIVETEAYDGPEDRASHASRRRTPRNEVMFGPPGHIYVYLIYGMYHCLNFVTGPEGYPAAVLIRALEPLEGVDSSTQGPGRLCRAMGIDLGNNLEDATRGPLFVAPRGLREDERIVTSPRIGVDYAGDWTTKPYRFSVDGNRWVSRRPARPGRVNRRGRRSGRRG